MSQAADTAGDRAATVQRPPDDSQKPGRWPSPVGRASQPQGTAGKVVTKSPGPQTGARLCFFKLLLLSAPRSLAQAIRGHCAKMWSHLDKKTMAVAFRGGRLLLAPLAPLPLQPLQPHFCPSRWRQNRAPLSVTATLRSLSHGQHSGDPSRDGLVAAQVSQTCPVLLPEPTAPSTHSLSPLAWLPGCPSADGYAAGNTRVSAGLAVSACRSMGSLGRKSSVNSSHSH